MTIQQQTNLIERTNSFIEKFGVSRKWLASKVNIREKDFSGFINQRIAISKNQSERLEMFLNEYERRMVGFDAVEN